MIWEAGLQLVITYLVKSGSTESALIHLVLRTDDTVMTCDMNAFSTNGPWILDGLATGRFYGQRALLFSCPMK